MNILHARSKYETFLCILEKGGLTAAAEEMGCTQSNITHILKSLEDEFGFMLFARGRSGAVLTPEGLMMLPCIRAAAEAERRMRAEAEEIRRHGCGEIRIGAFTSVSVNWLPGIIGAYRDLHPGMEFKLFSGDYHDMDLMLRDNGLDVAFVTRDRIGGCRLVPLLEDPVMAVLPLSHPLAAGKSVKAADLKGENIICLPEDSDDDSRTVFEKAGFEPNIRFTTKDDYAIIAMVAGGLGISLMPQLLLNGRGDNVRILPLDPPSSRMISLAVPERSMESRTVSEFAEFVSKWVGGQESRRGERPD